jgi:cytochrome c biogenesis protein CcmG/thiol:disulfide interchange protein DsbE
MKKYFLIIPAVLFFCIIMAFFYLLLIDRNPSDIPSALINQKAPIFEALSLFDNKSFNFADELGDETTIVNFFASWCAPCRAEHKYIDLLSKEKKIKVIGINFKDENQKAIKWLKELGNPYSIVAVDSDGSIGMDWGVFGLPETFIVDADNIIKYKHLGPITKKIYDDFYSKIMEIK